MREFNVYGILRVYSVTISCRHYFEIFKRVNLINKGFRSPKFPKNPYFPFFVRKLGQLPAERGIPLSRFSITEIVREVISQAIVPSVSDSSVWRWLHEDAIRPWFHRSWIYPRDPNFIEKAGRVLDIYAKQ